MERIPRTIVNFLDSMERIVGSLRSVATFLRPMFTVCDRNSRRNTQYIIGVLKRSSATVAWIQTRKRFRDRNDDGSDARPAPFERAYVVLFCAETYKQTYGREDCSHSGLRSFELGLPPFNI